MEWLNKITTTIAVAVIAGLAIAWLTGFFNQFVPSPGMTWLAGKNLLRMKHGRSEDRFRFVLSWLENDRDGDDTKIVAQAFSSIQGVTLARSARIVKASGAADDWLPAMQKSARSMLDRWNADLAMVGLVKTPGEVLSLWLVPPVGDGTLGSGDRPYVLEDATLGRDFHDDFQAQLTALALAAIAPLADTATRGRCGPNAPQHLRRGTQTAARLRA